MVKNLTRRITQLGCLILFSVACNHDGQQQSLKPADPANEAAIAASIATDAAYTAYLQQQNILSNSVKQLMLGLGQAKAISYAKAYQAGRLTPKQISDLVNKIPGYKENNLAMASNLAVLADKFALRGKSPEAIKRIFTLADDSFRANPGNNMKLLDCPCNPDPGWGDDPNPPENPDDGDGGDGGSGDGGGGSDGGGGGGGGGGSPGWTPPGQSALSIALHHCYTDENVIQKAALYVGYCAGSSDPGQCIKDAFVGVGIDFVSCVLGQLMIADPG